jgi:hypothetical protein
MSLNILEVTEAAHVRRHAHNMELHAAKTRGADRSQGQENTTNNT